MSPQVPALSRPLTSRAIRAIELSDAVAAELGDRFVGTEHLLLGLLRDPICPGAQILTHLGVTPDAVLAVLHDALGRES